MLDGPVGYVRSVDRDRSFYPLEHELTPGEKFTRPDYSCEKLTMELPPESRPDCEW